MFDLCMHFLRYQEFYESPEFAGKKFTILEFMEWYSKTHGGGAFTYPKDWAGFNIPSSVIWRVHSAGILDHNKYDSTMIEVYNKISANTHLVKGCTKNDDFYILGACKADIKTLDHEIAHALYSTNINYYDDMNNLRETLPASATDNITGYLTELGYNKKVFNDELQAYLATGVPSELKKAGGNIKKYIDQFERVFKKHTKNINFDLTSVKPLEFR